jgi:hypothetical protein
MKKTIHKYKSELSTVLGCVVAIANSYANVDWSTFTWDAKHTMPLLVSAVVAIGGYMTSINLKDENN